jgi:hypothetical protein
VNHGSQSNPYRWVLIQPALSDQVYINAFMRKISINIGLIQLIHFHFSSFFSIILCKHAQVFTRGNRVREVFYAVRGRTMIIPGNLNIPITEL